MVSIGKTGRVTATKHLWQGSHETWSTWVWCVVTWQPGKQYLLPFPVTYHGTQHPANIFGIISAGHISNRVTTEIQTPIQNGEADAQNVFFKLFTMGRNDPFCCHCCELREQEAQWWRPHGSFGPFTPWPSELTAAEEEPLHPTFTCKLTRPLTLHEPEPTPLTWMGDNRELFILSLSWTQEQVSLSSLGFSIYLMMDQAKCISRFLCGSDSYCECVT